MTDQYTEKKARTGSGLVHIYCGDGKGKTTAGIGQCVRAAGYGYRVLIYQFMKDNSSSERNALRLIPGITLIDGPEQVQFSFRMTEEEKEERRRFYRQELSRIARLAAEQETDVLFLDEAIYAVRCGLLDEDSLIRFLETRPDRLEVILTGRDPGEKLCACADYISEIRKVRHPFDQGQPARSGIER